MAAKKTTRTTAKKAAPRRKRTSTIDTSRKVTPPTLVLDPAKIDGTSVQALQDALSVFNPNTPIALGSLPIPHEVYAKVAEAPVKAGGILDLLMRHSELIEQLFDAISEHREKIEPVMATPPPSEAGAQEANGPGVESDVGYRLMTQSERLAIAIDCLRRLTGRVQL